MKKIIIFVLSLCIFVTLPARVNAASTDFSTDIKAKSYILMSIDTGDVICENNSNERLSPASVTKIMSLLIIFDALYSGRISLDDMVCADENAVSKGGSQIWLEVGEMMSVNDLLKAVIIASANDACTLLGEYVAGSDTAFVELMNNKADELGLRNTHFENCTGLDDSTTNHYSSAYDLAVISKEVMKYDLIYDYSTVWLDYLRDGKTELNNTNKLVNTYSGITGLKTGTTSNAGFCVSATAKRDETAFVSVVLGAENSDDRFALASSLLDYGFANYKSENISINTEDISSVAVKGGTIKEITPTFELNNKILLSKEITDLEYVFDIPEEIEAPVSKGQELGKIIVKSDDEQVSEVKLISDTEIKKIDLKYIFFVLFKNI